MLKTIFFGTPSVAVPFLERLNQISQVILVVTQPDRPSGRGMEVKPCPVKKRALELGLNVISPEKFKDSVPFIETLKADLGIAVAYGKIFRKPALEALKHGIINIHFSLLPKYRGAAPVQHTFFNNEKETGITAFWIDEGLDSGLVAAVKKTDILQDDDSATMFPKLMALGVEALKEVAADVENGKINKAAQQGNITLAPMIEKQDTLLSFKDMDAQTIHNKVRGLACAMPAYAKALTPKGDIIQILKTTVKAQPQNSLNGAAAGAITAIERNKGFFVQCKKDIIFIETIRPAGKNAMNADAYRNGKNLAAGDVLFA